MKRNVDELNGGIVASTTLSIVLVFETAQSQRNHSNIGVDLEHRMTLSREKIKPDQVAVRRAGIQ